MYQLDDYQHLSTIYHSEVVSDGMNTHTISESTILYKCIRAMMNWIRVTNSALLSAMIFGELHI